MGIAHCGRGLQHQPHDTLALVLELEPALQDVDQLEVRVAPVRLAWKLTAGREPRLARPLRQS